MSYRSIRVVVRNQSCRMQQCLLCFTWWMFSVVLCNRIFKYTDSVYFLCILNMFVELAQSVLILHSKQQTLNQLLKNNVYGKMEMLQHTTHCMVCSVS